MIKKFIPVCLLVLFSVSAFAQDFPYNFPVKLNKLTTVEKSRRHFNKVACCSGEIRKYPFIEVTYVTTDKCGKSVEWKKVYKNGGPTTKTGVPIDQKAELTESVTNTVNSIFNPNIIRTIIGTNE